jgi:two-component system invasion response regulator UvrY
MIRILIADDHLMFRQGIGWLLAEEKDLELVAQASHYGEVVAALRSQRIDLVILDLSMPGRDGIEAISHLRQIAPGLRILVLTMHHEEQYAARALRAGCHGYLTKDYAAEQLVEAVRRVAAGGAYVCPSIAERLAMEFSRHDPKEMPHSRLSNREYRVFEMLVDGKSGIEIAAALSLSAKTVSTHKARLLRKMNMHNQSELVRYAVEHDLLQH